MATGTSELNQFLENVGEVVLECTICLKRLENPKSLNCLHTYCLACLEDWVKEKGILTCPTCSKSYPIPDGGLQKLPPNTILNNLIATIDKFSKTDQMKCFCAKGQAKCYCQECRHYLCSNHSEDHRLMPLSANHKLHSVEEVQSMTPLQIAALHPPLCSLHKKPLEFFCCICNIPICTDCAITDHSAGEGNHKPISISKAFQTFKETSAALEKAANDSTNKLQDGLKEVVQTATKLQQSKDTSLRDIDNHVQEMCKKMKEKGDQMKNKVETIYKNKKEVLDVQMDELKTTISDINIKLSWLSQLLKRDEATAMQSSERVITTLMDRINKLPKTRPDDHGQIKYYINQQQSDSLQQHDIGNVRYLKVLADSLKLNGEESVTQGQTIVVQIIKTEECEIHKYELTANWTEPTGETNIAQVQENDNGDYFVTGKCTNPGVCKIDVSANGVLINQSPMIIKVEKEGLVNSIKTYKIVRDVVKCEDDSLLVSCLTNEILKYNQLGLYIGKITLPQGVKVHRMVKMKNGNIAFSDKDNKCITVCNMNGQVIKSIGQGELKSPRGIYVDEASNHLYVADWNIGCVCMFNIDNGKMIKNIGSPCNKEGQMRAADVTLTNQGYVLVLECLNRGLQLFDNEGRFMKVLVEAGDENGKVENPQGVVVDKDDNIIVLSDHKLQLFSRDGNFIKRIDKKEDGIQDPRGLSIISYHPRKFAVGNKSDKTIKIFNY